METPPRELAPLTSAVAHDLKAPLRHILGFANLATHHLDEGAADEARRCLGTIRAAGQRLLGLIDRVVEHSRLEAADRAEEDVDLEAAVDRVAAELRAALDATGGRVERGRLPVVRGDRRLLGELLRHLVDNAVKYRGAAPPVVRVDAFPDGDGLRVAVSDNGIGIDPRFVDAVFEPLRRLHTHDEVEGYGIGLGTCRTVVEKHGGRLWVESTPGEGSTFHFTLPA
ncbi:MAG: ATP-binding protein [Sandaracinaceae bacterium]